MFIKHFWSSKAIFLDFQKKLVIPCGNLRKIPQEFGGGQSDI